MQVGDLVKAYETIKPWNEYIGVITAITLDHPYKESGQYRYKVFFPNAPHSWWNEGTWNKKALELL